MRTRQFAATIQTRFSQKDIPDVPEGLNEFATSKMMPSHLNS